MKHVLLTFAVTTASWAAGGCSDADPDQGGLPSADTDPGDPSSAPAEIELRTITANGFDFDARLAGPSNGPLVLFLHGFPSSSHAFEPVLRDLARDGYRGVAFDLRGYSDGARPQGDANYSLTALSQDVIAVADSMQADRFHLVGHDWGAAIAWLTAATNPDRVETLTALSIPHPAALQSALADPQSGQQEASVYTDVLRQADAAQQLLADDSRALRMLYGDDPNDQSVEFFGVDVSSDAVVPNEGIQAYVDRLRDPPGLDAALAYYRANWPALEQPTVALDGLRIQAPTLYIWGEQDFAVTFAAASASQRFVDAPYRFVALPTNHWIPELASDQLSSALREHLDDHKGE